MKDSPGLSEAELNELAAFLLSEKTPEYCMDISMLDGFLVCMLLGPDTILPDKWLPVVWGEGEEDAIEWESDLEANRIIGLLMNHFNGISSMFEHDLSAYKAYFYRDKEGNLTLNEWCKGFVEGMRLAPDYWEKILMNPELNFLLAPMVLFGSESGLDISESEKKKLEGISTDEWADRIVQAIFVLNEFLLPYRKSVRSGRTPTAVLEVGRNDPCPCGSGKKYKHCCMKKDQTERGEKV